MIILQIYAIFCLATAFTAQYELIGPVLSKQESDTKRLIESRGLIIMTFFFLNILAAPLVFLSCIIPEWGVRFRETLQTALFVED